MQLKSEKKYLCKEWEHCGQWFFERLEVVQHAHICRDWVDPLVSSFALGYSKNGFIFFAFAEHWLHYHCCYCCADVIILWLFSLCMCLLLPVQYIILFFPGKSWSSSPLLIQSPLKDAILKLAQQKKKKESAFYSQASSNWTLWLWVALVVFGPSPNVPSVCLWHKQTIVVLFTVLALCNLTGQLQEQRTTNVLPSPIPNWRPNYIS